MAETVKKLCGEHDFPYPYINIWAEKNKSFFPRFNAKGELERVRIKGLHESYEIVFNFLIFDSKIGMVGDRASIKRSSHRKFPVVPINASGTCSFDLFL